MGMSGKSTSIVIGEHYQKLIQQEIDAGYGSNTSEVIRQALALLEDKIRERDSEIAFSHFMAEIQKGLDSPKHTLAEAKALLAEDKKVLIQEAKDKGYI